MEVTGKPKDVSSTASLECGKCCISHSDITSVVIWGIESMHFRILMMTQKGLLTFCTTIEVLHA
jgi:hypothetical protein